MLIFLTLLSGCSTTRVVENSGDVGAPPSPVEPTCRDSIIGVVTFSDWCAVDSRIPIEHCDCSSEESSALSEIFTGMAGMGMAPSDLSAWYAALPSDLPPSRILEWMKTGVPVSDVRTWFDLGYEPKITAQYYRIGRPVAEIRSMISMGLSPEGMVNWLDTKLPMPTWHYWINENVSPAVAKSSVDLYGLNTPASISAFLVDRRFVSLTPDVRPRSWICSRDNIVSQVVSATRDRVDYIQRFVLLDLDGYAAPAMTLFERNPNFSNYSFSRRIARGWGATSNWTVCPAVVVSEIAN